MSKAFAETGDEDNGRRQEYLTSDDGIEAQFEYEFEVCALIPYMLTIR